MYRASVTDSGDCDSLLATRELAFRFQYWDLATASITKRVGVRPFILGLYQRSRESAIPVIPPCLVANTIRLPEAITHF
jgi:hypothetical protein